MCEKWKGYKSNKYEFDMVMATRWILLLLLAAFWFGVWKAIEWYITAFNNINWGLVCG